MEKSYTSIVGLPVAVEGLGKLTRVTDILIDTDTGNIVAFYVSEGQNRIIAPIDILFFGQAIIISDQEDIIDATDLVKVQDVLKKDIRLMKNRVETQKGEYLGNVYDYYIDTKSFYLTKILVHKSIFGLLKSPDRLIPATDIVKIKKGLTIVKNKYSTKYADSKEKSYAEISPDLAA